MSTLTGTKINKLLTMQPPGTVMLSSWLVEQGYSHDLQQRYKKGGWLESVGTGAFIRKNEHVKFHGAIYALQNQAGFSIHPGGRTALSLSGKAQYIELNESKVVLFGGAHEKLPAWFRHYDWGVPIEYHSTSFLKKDIGFTEMDTGNFTIRISNAARAMMECLYLSPDKQDLVESYELMEGLNNLSPKLVQSLLENCQSIKVKRLFLYMAEKAKHPWLTYLDITKIDLGKGKRSIVKSGAFIEKYGITVPKELK
jgi:hypothetical protein